MMLVAACTSGGDAALELTGQDRSDNPPTSEATSEVDSEPNRGVLPMGPDGPLLGIATVARRPSGLVVEPQAGFTTDDTEATVLISLADDVDADADATLTVSWYVRTAPNERQLLFEHAIVVGPTGLAWSQGVAPTGLAPGVYETVAALGDHAVQMPWIVEPVATGVAATGDEDWNIPSEGDSGWYTPDDTPIPDFRAGPCSIQSVHGAFTPIADVYVMASWYGTCSTMTLAATVSGPLETLFEADTSQDENGIESSRSVTVCDLPGGSDLPGTVVSVSATGSDGSTATGSTTLSDHGVAVVAGIESRPPAPAAVRAGQTIDLAAMGMVMPPALGIESLAVLAGDEVIDATKNLSGTDEPVACDQGRFYAQLATQYRVPDAPAPVIEICAVTVTFDGHTDESCARFTTGESWTGTMRLSFDGNVASQPDVPCRGTADFDISFSVSGADVTGSGNIDGAPYICDAGGIQAPGPDPSGPLTVHGTKTDTGFDLVVTPGPGVGCCAAWPGASFGTWQMPIEAPGRAEVAITSTESFGQPWQGTLSLTGTFTCSTCRAGG
jgi:hypothetical protein